MSDESNIVDVRVSIPRNFRGGDDTIITEKVRVDNPGASRAINDMQDFLTRHSGPSVPILEKWVTYGDLWKNGLIRLRDSKGRLIAPDKESNNIVLVPPQNSIDTRKPPTATGLQVDLTATHFVVSWDAANFDYYKATEIWRANVNNLGSASKIAETNAATYSDPIFEPGDKYYWIRHVSTSTPPVYGDFNSVVGLLAPPAVVGDFGYVIEPFGPRITWRQSSNPAVVRYELRLGASFDAGTPLEGTTPTLVDGTNYLWRVKTAGTYQLHIKAIDSLGTYSTVSASINVVVPVPPALVATGRFEAENYILEFATNAGAFEISRYRIRRGANFSTAVLLDEPKINRFVAKADWNGSEVFWVSQVDVAENESNPASVELVVTPPSAVSSYTVEVIDNTAKLTWGTPIAGTLPLKRFLLRKGASFEAGENIGDKAGDQRFTTWWEPIAGDFTFWLAAQDTAGNIGPAIPRLGKFSSPPDYILRQDWGSDFSGTKVNCFVEDGDLFGPVNTTETWDQHFSTRGWANTDAQVAAGYPLVFMPGTTTASYEEVFDYGTTIPSTIINVIPTIDVLSGSISTDVTISVSNNSATGPWTNYSGTQAFSTNFRWVKVKIDWTASGLDDYFSLRDLHVRLQLKQIRDGGNATANASDFGGTTVFFNKVFLDCSNPMWTPLDTRGVEWLVEFNDVPNPTQFKIQCFDRATGNRVTRAGVWSVEGV